MNKKLKLALLLLLIGLIGVLSTLVYYPVEGETLNFFFDFKTLWQHNSFQLITPAFAVLIAVVVGTLLYDKVNLKVPLLESLVDKNKNIDTSGILLYGIVGGIIAGILYTLITIVFRFIITPETLSEIGNSKSNLIIRIINGGTTWEIMHRFGFMTFIVWLIAKVSGKLTPSVYWIAIIVMAIFFLATIFIPRYVVLGMPTVADLSYISLVVILPHTIYGWLYWKKGLEAAMIAHMILIIVATIGKYMLDM